MDSTSTEGTFEKLFETDHSLRDLSMWREGPDDLLPSNMFRAATDGNVNAMHVCSLKPQSPALHWIPKNQWKL